MRALGLLLLALALGVSSVGAMPTRDEVGVSYNSSCTLQLDHHYVYDFASVTNEETGVRMEGSACQLFRSDSAELVVVLVDSTGELTPYEYAVELAKAWNVGDAERDDGIVVLWAHNNGADSLGFSVGHAFDAAVGGREPSTAYNRYVHERQVQVAAGADPKVASREALANAVEELAATTAESYTGPKGTDEPVPGGIFGLPFWVWAILIVVPVSLILMVFFLVPKRKRRQFVPRRRQREGPGGHH